MELERPRASASLAPAALAPTASVSSVTPAASVTSAAPLAPVASVIPTASVASLIPPASVASVASVISPRTHSPTVISDDEETTVSHSPITISDDEEEEIAPVRRLPTLRHPQTLVDPQYGGDSDEETSISAAPQAESSGQVGGSKTPKRIEFDEPDCRLVFMKALLCKTFTPQDEYADLDTVLYSFREVIRREIVPILAEHPGG